MLLFVLFLLASFPVSHCTSCACIVRKRKFASFTTVFEAGTATERTLLARCRDESPFSNTSGAVYSLFCGSLASSNDTFDFALHRWAPVLARPGWTDTLAAASPPSPPPSLPDVALCNPKRCCCITGPVAVQLHANSTSGSPPFSGSLTLRAPVWGNTCLGDANYTYTFSGTLDAYDIYQGLAKVRGPSGDVLNLVLRNDSLFIVADSLRLDECSQIVRPASADTVHATAVGVAVSLGGLLLGVNALLRNRLPATATPPA